MTETFYQPLEEPMTKPITGGCICGVLRYEIDAEPMMAGHCQCSTARSRRAPATPA